MHQLSIAIINSIISSIDLRPVSRVRISAFFAAVSCTIVHVAFRDHVSSAKVSHVRRGRRVILSISDVNFSEAVYLVAALIVVYLSMSNFHSTHLFYLRDIP